MTETVKSRIIKTELVEWADIFFIQPKGFKELHPAVKEKLKASILSAKFTQPFYVWQDTKDRTICGLDGFHRSMVLKELRQEGHKIPNKLPATFVECKDRKEAAHLVLQYSAIYANLTLSGVDEFLRTYSLPIDDLMATLELPDVDLSRLLGDEGRDFSEQNAEMDLEDFGDEVIMKLRFTKSDFLEVKRTIKTRMECSGYDSPEELIKNLLLYPNRTGNE